jgi:RsiW-degrading membrane proteinase PrsW (M82 family)
MWRNAAFVLFGLSLVWLAIDAPASTGKELQFLLEIGLLTLVTRTVSLGSNLSAFGLGLGFAVPLVVAAGYGLTALGVDITSGPANWGLVPVIEEGLKLAPVGFVVWLHARRSKLPVNPSDLLALGCFAGAGFALAENSMLAQQGIRLTRDMARHYGPHIGPFYLVPGAWGIAGYVGHAAATGLICAGLGLGLSIRHRARSLWWLVPAACAAWVVGEHVLTNLYVGTGSRAALSLGNGRVTPWIFVAVAIAVVVLDWQRAGDTLAHSRMLRQRIGMSRAALLRVKPPRPASRLLALEMYVSQLRVLNATAWLVRGDPRLAGRPS